MNRNFSLFVTLVVVSLLFVGMGMGMGAAQENATNETDAIADELEDELANETSESTGALDNQETIEFTEHTRIIGWEFRSGQVAVAIESERRSEVTLSDALAGIGEDGAVQVPETSSRLERHDVTTVTMDLTEFRGGKSVSVEVDGMTVRLSTEIEDQDDNPLQYFGGESGLFTGMGMSVVMAGGAAAFVVWREDKGVIEA